MKEIQNFDKRAKKYGMGGLARIFLKSYIRELLESLRKEDTKDIIGVDVVAGTERLIILGYNNCNAEINHEIDTILKNL